MSMTIQSGSNGATAQAGTPSLGMRLLALGYGGIAYLIFLGSFLYAIGFVSRFVVPKTIDTGPASSWPTALAIDLVLMSIFAVQHSVMARQGFKKLFARFAAPAIERSTFVLLASLSLILPFWQWQPMPTIWNIEAGLRRGDHQAAIGWLMCSTAFLTPFRTVRIDAGSDALRRTRGNRQFKTPGLSPDPHPIYLGFIIASGQRR